MTRLSFLAAALATAGMAAGANAAVFVDGGVGGHLTYHLHNTADATSSTVTLDVLGQTFLVDLSAKTGGVGDDLNQGGMGNGFAIVNGTPQFDEMTITPQNFAGFGKLQFFLQYQQKVDNPTAPPPQLNINYGSFLLSYTLVGGGSGSQLVNIENGNQRFQLFGDNNEVFSSVTLSQLKGTAQDGSGPPFNVNAAFENARQLSFEAAAVVPEPAAWAMMIGGFGLVGAAMRRRQRTSVMIA